MLWVLIRIASVISFYDNLTKFSYIKYTPFLFFCFNKQTLFLHRLRIILPSQKTSKTGFTLHEYLGNRQQQKHFYLDGTFIYKVLSA